MSKRSRTPARRHTSPPLVRALTWLAIVGVVAAVVYGASQMAGVPYGEDAIRVVSFASLEASERRSVLKTANRERCTCSCGMTLAQCVATDMTCPVREANIERIRKMVGAARIPPPRP